MSAIQVAATLYLHELLPRLRKARIEDPEDGPITAGMLAGLAICKAEGLLSTHQIRLFMNKCFESCSS